MHDAAINHFDSRRYWADSVPVIGAFDPMDAILDREDSLSERNAFQIGREFGMHRLFAASRPGLPSPLAMRGNETGPHGRPAVTTRRAGLYQRKLLGLRAQAFRRGIPMSSAITVDYLRSITVQKLQIALQVRVSDLRDENLAE